MKRFATIAITAAVGASVLAGSLTTPAHAGKREKRIFAGIVIGAIGGAIIAKQVERRNKKKARRKQARRAAALRQQNQRRTQANHRRSYAAEREFFDPYARSDYRYDRGFYQPEYRDDYRQNRRDNRRASNQQSDWQRHVNACLKAYRSYDPQSDTYLTRDGREKLCRR